jgi:hypothetical protein
VSGIKILYTHDLVGGSAYFIENGSETYTFASPADLSKAIDAGEYSIEKIFGRF